MTQLAIHGGSPVLEPHKGVFVWPVVTDSPGATVMSFSS